MAQPKRNRWPTRRALLTGLLACAALPAGAAAFPSTGDAARSAVSGAFGELSPVTVLGLGDSVPAGTACDCTDFVALLAQRPEVRRHHRVVVHNLASGGTTSAGLLTVVHQAATVRAARAARAAVVTIGANDFSDDGLLSDQTCSPEAGLRCYQDTLGRLRTNLLALFAELRRDQPAGSVVVATGYWNVFLDGVAARTYGPVYVRNSDALTRAVNAVIEQTATASGARYVDLYRVFKSDTGEDDSRLLAPDGDHPHQAGHRLIAEAVARALAGS